MIAISPRDRAFTLVEVTLALGVVAFALLAIFGLLPVGINMNKTSIEQTAATNLALGITADLRATPTTAPATAQTSPRYLIPIPASGTATATLFLREDGAAAGPVNTNANPANDPRYRVTISFYAPPTATQRTATKARILVTWPALADQSAAATPSNFAGSFETFTALDRN